LGAYLVGPNGKSVGVEVLKIAVDFAQSCVADLKNRGVELKNVVYEHRNVFVPDIEERKWDRIHVGGCCPQKYKHALYELLKPGGIIVMPIGNHLIKAEKDGNGFTTETVLLDVRYGDLVVPSEDEVREALRKKSLQIKMPSSSINNDYLKMFNNSFLSDVCFIIDGKRIAAHKAILASRCEYYSSLYHSGMSDSEKSEIYITAHSYAAFFQLIRFIYTDECTCDSPELAAELMAAAEFYRLDRLKAWAEFLLSKALNVDTACGILEVAHLHNAMQLKRVAFDFIMQNYEDVSKTDSFDSMHKECYREILHVAMNKLRHSPTSSPFGSPPKF